MGKTSEVLQKLQANSTKVELCGAFRLYKIPQVAENQQTVTMVPIC